MTSILRGTAVATAVAAVGATAAVANHRRAERWAAAVQDRLTRTPAGGVCTPDTVAGQPEPVRRYLLHAVAPGTPLHRTAVLRQRASMRPRPGARSLAVTAEEILTPAAGLLWRAKASMGPVQLRIVDHYVDGDGAVQVMLPGGLAVMRSTGPDTARSTRHRVVAEAVWVPTALVPSAAVSWRALDDDHIRYEVVLDGEAVGVDLRIDGAGRVEEIAMHRHGNTGVPDWGLLPYGFACTEERTFGGCTIPTRFTGGWWYGTERDDPEAATDFEVVDADYR